FFLALLTEIAFDFSWLRHASRFYITDRLISRPIGVAEDVFVKVGTFHFPADFVVGDFDADPRAPLILERSFLKTGRALIDVFEGELTLRLGKEAITFNLDQTSRYPANYNDMTANRIDVIDMACEEYSQKLLGFFDVIASANPTPYYDPIVSTTSPTLTPFGNSYFLLEEVDAFLALEDDPTSPEVDQSYVDTEGDILILESFLNDDPSLPPPNQGNYLSQVRKELKICEAKTDKSSIDEPPEVELNLPPYLEYVFLEVLKSHKRAIAWKLSDIKGIDPEFCTHKILIEEDFEPAVQHQRRVNPKIHDVIKNEVLKLLDAGLIYPISDSPWRCMIAIFHDMIEKTVKVFMDDFSVFGNSFQTYLSHLEKMLKRCEDTNLCLNWEKSHFMVKEGIVLGHKISKNRIEVDKVKVEIIAKLPHPTTVKGIRSFLDHAGFYRRFIQDFSKITRPMTHLLEKDTPFFFSKEFETPRAIISDRGTHFCNDQFAKVMLKFGVTHRLATPYHPQISGQVKVSNRGLKCILERTVGENHASWSDKLDDALWAFRTSYKTPIGCTPYKLVYEKACHLPIEFEHKAYWALKHANFDLQTVGDHRNVQLNELNELRDQGYENSLIYKEKTKRIHDSKIKDRIFNIGDRVLLFNSRLKIFSSKLKSRWSGPFTISHVFSYGTVKLSQPDGPNFKVNGHRLKHYFGEDVPKMVVTDLQTFPKDQ
nr:reverse transcriptase domain-containing protein [Tanacetum cinerariifolium]